MASAVRLTPIYVGLTGALWMFLLIGGDRPLTAFCRAMSAMSTSGISPGGGVQNAAAGSGGEMVIFLFLFFALSRMTFATDTTEPSGRRKTKSPKPKPSVINCRKLVSRNGDPFLTYETLAALARNA